MIKNERLAYLASLPDLDGFAAEEVQMARELLSLRQRVVKLEQERDEWREDATRLIKHVLFFFYGMGMDDPPDGSWEDAERHNALLEKHKDA